MRRRECLYYMSLGYYRLGNYEEARKFNGAYLIFFQSNIYTLTFVSQLALLLDKEPGNLQAQSLGAIIDKAATRGKVLFLRPSSYIDAFASDSYVGMAIAGGAAALGTLLIAGLIKSSRSRK